MFFGSGWTVAMQVREVAFGAVLSDDVSDRRQNLLRKKCARRQNQRGE